jgi:hypothetical protein
VLLGVLGGLILRRLNVVRAGGVDVAYRTAVTDASGGGWRLGIGQYRGSGFLWYRVVGVTTAPTRQFHRENVEILERRAPTGQELYAMPAEAVIVRCRFHAGECELAMNVDALTGFLSWLEAAPGSNTVRFAF